MGGERRRILSWNRKFDETCRLLPDLITEQLLKHVWIVIEDIIGYNIIDGADVFYRLRGKVLFERHFYTKRPFQRNNSDILGNARTLLGPELHNFNIFPILGCLLESLVDFLEFLRL